MTKQYINDSRGQVDTGGSSTASRLLRFAARSERLCLLVAFAVLGCAGQPQPPPTSGTPTGQVQPQPTGPPASQRPGAVPPAATPPPAATHPSPAGRQLWEQPGADMHGSCCSSDAQCSGLSCAAWPYASASCPRVCRLRCVAADRCPRLGGVLYDPNEYPACATDGFCPVGSPRW